MPENSNCSGASSCSKESCEGCPSNAKNKAGGGIAKEPMNAASNVKKVIGSCRSTCCWMTRRHLSSGEVR